jgi:DNA-binding response OmpR family regulator
MKLLTVSEDPKRHRFVAGALGNAWLASEAFNGIEARRLAAEDAFTLVIADETTEPFGAFGLARELKMLERPPAVVVLLERRQDGWLARWSGADRWLLWPVDPFALAEVAEELAQKSAGSRRDS